LIQALALKPHGGPAVAGPPFFLAGRPLQGIAPGRAKIWLRKAENYYLPGIEFYWLLGLISSSCGLCIAAGPFPDFP
jgi:hypothetical protein